MIRRLEHLTPRQIERGLDIGAWVVVIGLVSFVAWVYWH